MKNLTNKKSKLIIFWTLFALSIFLVIYGSFLKCASEELSLDAVLMEMSAQFPKPKIESLSYLIGDVNSGKIITKKNGNVHFFPASLTKLMTAVIVLENFKLNEEIIISPNVVGVEGNKVGLTAGEKIDTDSLLKILLISSSNEAAVAFEEALEKKGQNFVSLMNKKARDLELFNTAFFDTTGLDRKGNFTSIEDLFKLSREIYRNYPYLGEITRKKEEIVYSLDKEIIHNLKNTNILTEEIPNLWGGKTGSTPEARDCLLTIYEFPFSDKNDKIVISVIVLNSPDRFGDTIKLYNWIKEVIERVKAS